MTNDLPFDLPADVPDGGHRLVVLDAPPGRDRLPLLQQYGATLHARGVDAWTLDCDIATGGPWAGVRDFLREIVPDLRRDCPDLVTRHDYELVMIAPWLRSEITPRNLTLTDQAHDDERVRNYPLDRAFRLVHGAVDLAAAWRRACGGRPWVLLCEGFDKRAALPRRFFRDLFRRLDPALRLTIVAVVDEGCAEDVVEEFAFLVPVTRGRVGEDAGPSPRTTTTVSLPDEALSPDEARARALALEAQVGKDVLQWELHFPELLRLWTAADDREAMLRWAIFWLGMSNHRGFYEDALYRGDLIRAYLRDTAGIDEDRRWNLVGNMFHGLTVNGASNDGLAFVEEEAAAKLEAPRLRLRAYYVLAMLHARYLPEHDFDKAEALLQEALRILESVDIPEDVRHFQIVFISNGLAFVRHRQGRPEDAIRLCREGFARLEETLSPERHRLHRSVLLYNAAQVHAALGQLEEAVTYYSKAVEMDPHYSEYFNERASALLRLGRLADAERDLLTAIELSPPYPEVWTNLGQCYRKMGRADEAVAAYSRALDLEPGLPLARVGRAQAREALGRRTEALEDYSIALDQDPHQPMLLANRAVLHYLDGRLDASLADLDRAIALNPRMPDLYVNRSIALRDLGRVADAVRDLREAVGLTADAAERASVEAQLRTLEEQLAHVGHEEDVRPQVSPLEG